MQSQGSCGPWLQEKARLKAEKEAAEAKFKFAMVDGKKEQVGPCVQRCALA